MKWSVSIRLSVSLIIVILLSHSGPALARYFRPSKIPNGEINRCLNCHAVEFPVVGNGFRNQFGMDVEPLVTPDGMESFWTETLAFKDSDGGVDDNDLLILMQHWHKTE